jgi:hypothetical protein
MKKILLTILMIIAVSWTCDVSSAKDKNTGDLESKRKSSEKLQEEAKVKGKAAEKAGNIDKSKTDEAAGKVSRDKAEAAKKAAVKGKEKVAAKENVTAKGKEHQQQINALDKQMVRDEAKFLKDTARLKRIRELAVAKGDTKTVERVDKLIAKAQQINSDKHKRMQERKLKILQSGEAKTGQDIPKVPDRSSDKGKAKIDKAAETEQPKTTVKPEDEKVKEEPVRPEVKPGDQREDRKAEKKADEAQQR